MTAPTGTAGPAGLSAQGWGWRYAGRRAPAVRDVSLRVEPGERMLLLGASGSGKSTLLAGIAGLLGGADEGEASGSLFVDGRLPATQRGRIGLVLQDPEAGIVLSRVGDDVAFGPENLSVPAGEIPARVAEALEAVGLSVALDRPTRELSGGQKQRLALAGVLAMRPGILLLDEPTANLDPDGVAEVRAAVERIVRETGATLIVIEHRTAVWQDLMHRVVVLDAAGGVLADGTPARVFAEHGDALAAAGVWVPGHPVPLPVLDGASGAAIVSARGLAVSRDGRTPVLAGLDLDVGRGSATVITGANGAGKSTLALTLAGLLPDDEVSRLVDALLERIHLAPLARANPFTLSGGQKRRLSVATVLAAAPGVLVLDEPTFGQDRRGWIELVALLQEEIARGTAVVAVTHDADVVRHLGGRRLDLGAPRVGA